MLIMMLTPLFFCPTGAVWTDSSAYGDTVYLQCGEKVKWRPCSSCQLPHSASFDTCHGEFCERVCFLSIPFFVYIICLNDEISLHKMYVLLCLVVTYFCLFFSPQSLIKVTKQLFIKITCPHKFMVEGHLQVYLQY